MNYIEPSMRPMLDMFIFETSLLLEKLDEIMIQTEKEKKFNYSNINETFRIMHTIKGSASMMGLDSMSALSHCVEDLFDIIREGKTDIIDDDLLFELVFQALDSIKIDINKLPSGDYIPLDCSKLIKNIKDYISILEASNLSKLELESSEEDTKVKDIVDLHFSIEDDKEIVKVVFEEDCMMENLRAFMLTIEIREYCNFIKFYPEDVDENTDTSEFIKKDGFYIQFIAKDSNDIIYDTIRDNLYVKEYETVQKSIVEKENFNEIEIQRYDTQIKLQENSFVEEDFRNIEEEEHLPLSKQNIMSVNLEKLDLLQNIVGEIVIVESMVVNSVESNNINMDNFNKATRQLNKLTDELQDIVMSMRMVSVAGVFKKMHRIVRDMNKKLQKNVELITIGDETEVDKSVIDNLSDPFMHIIRNAMDHAIESIDERMAKGKVEVGKITLSAKNLGREVIISISDDGRGLMKDKILDKAGEQGLLKRPSAEYTDEEINSLIMVPGFSTKENITEFSGRGVGMDIVRKSIERVGGSIEVKSKKDEGTTFTIKIPLTLSIVDGMEFKIGESLFTLPISSIRRTFKLEDLNQVIKENNERELITIYGACIPIIRLHKIYNIETDITDLLQGSMIVIENEHKAACIFVDEIIGNQQVVVKPFPVYFNRFNIKNKGFSGCTILGDGSISLIIDTDNIMEIY